MRANGPWWSTTISTLAISTHVLWAMCTRFDPNVDIDLVQKAWASKRDPLFLPGNFNNRILIDACIPYDMKLKGTFPPVVDVSANLRAKLRAKFPKLFH